MLLVTFEMAILIIVLVVGLAVLSSWAKRD
jgi:hypothetical protein